MPRRSKTEVEAGHLRSFWEELAEIEREYTAVCTVTFYPTIQRGVFSVRMGALLLGAMRGDEPASFVISRRLPDAGTMTFAGSLWDMSRKLNDMVTEADEAYKAAQAALG